MAFVKKYIAQKQRDYSVLFTTKQMAEMEQASKAKSNKTNVL